MRTTRLGLWIAALVSALLLAMIGCGGSNNNSGSNNGSGNTPNPGSANNGGSNTGGSSGGNTGGSNSGNSGGNGGNSSGGGAASAPEFLYLGSLTNSIGAYQVDKTSGALSAVAGQPFSSGMEPNTLATDPAVKYLYAGIGQQPGVRGANCSDSPTDIQSFTTAASGALTQLETKTLTTFCVQQVLVDPSGKNLYAFTADQSAANHYVNAFSIDAGTGKLTELPGSPFKMTSRPTMAVISADGRFIYATNYYPNSGLVVLQRDSTGALTEMQSFPLPNGAMLTDLAFARDGNYIVATSANGGVEDSLYLFTIDKGSGKIAAEINVTNENTTHSDNVTVDRTGQYVFVGSVQGGIRTFSMDTNGTLTYVSSVSSPAYSTDLTTDTTNHFVYQQLNTNAVGGYSLDTNTGKLTPLPGSPFTVTNQALGMLAVEKK